MNKNADRAEIFTTSVEWLDFIGGSLFSYMISFILNLALFKTGMIADRGFIFSFSFLGLIGVYLFAVFKLKYQVILGDRIEIIYLLKRPILFSENRLKTIYFKNIVAAYAPDSVSGRNPSAVFVIYTANNNKRKKFRMSISNRNQVLKVLEGQGVKVIYDYKGVFEDRI
jgi:hypothetical protein